MINVTIAIPTLNGAEYIKEAITSVLNQTYQGFELLIVDNHSTDQTKNIIKNIKDPRIRYVRNKKQIDIISNWNRCLALANGKYLLILGDDDVIYPNFLRDTVKILDKYPDVGFVFSKCYKIDENGKIKSPWGYQYLSSGKHFGSEYLLKTARLGVNLTNSTTALLNLKLVKRIGVFTPEIASNTFDFNMWLKIANHYNVYFVNVFLASYREHKKQVSECHWRGEFPSGKIGTQLEIVNALNNLKVNTGNKEVDPKVIKKLIEKSLIRIRTVLKDFDQNF